MTFLLTHSTTIQQPFWGSTVIPLDAKKQTSEIIVGTDYKVLPV
jgi:hypothetical protein